MSALALQRIQTAKEEKLDTLDLGNCGLNELPATLFELTALKSLILSSEWYEWNIAEKVWEKKQSANHGECNRLERIDPAIKMLGALEKLVIANIGIRQITPIAQLTSLKSLNLSHNQVSNLAAVAKLTSLQVLNVSDNQITKIAPLAQLTSLKFLNLSHNQVEDISPLAQLRSLTALDISHNQISNLSPIVKLTSLASLQLAHNHIQHITAIAELTSLESCNLSNNQISHLAAIAKLTALQSLNLGNNQVSDISPLAKLTLLQTLTLCDNKITKIAPIAELTLLRSLNISDNEVFDLAPLAKLKSLQWLNLYNNKIKDIRLLLSLAKKDKPIQLVPSDKQQGFIVGNNPITNPPLSVIEQGNLAMLQHFRALNKKSQKKDSSAFNKVTNNLEGAEENTKAHLDKQEAVSIIEPILSATKEIKGSIEKENERKGTAQQKSTQFVSESPLLTKKSPWYRKGWIIAFAMGLIGLLGSLAFSSLQIGLLSSIITGFLLYAMAYIIR